MNRGQAKRLIIETFENPFNKDNFVKFIKNLLKSYKEGEGIKFIYSGNYIPDPFEQYVSVLERIGKYNYDGKEIDLLIVYLKKETSLERARTTQRNFIAWYLRGSRGGKLKDAALVAFVSPDCEDWRFSLVKLEYTFKETSLGKKKVEEEFTPAKRWSFLVGKNEKSHTAQSRFIKLLENDEKPSLEKLEDAFNVEVVTKEFFEKYRDLFIKTKSELDKLVQNEPSAKQEFEKKNINNVNFAKKLLGQIIFLYFLQKKGWFGVERGKPWGTGPKNFIRRLFNREFGGYENFYNDILEPLFYEALRTDRSDVDHYFSSFKCKIPFLNGGLFDPINNFDWVNIDILLPDELFSNQNETKEGDIGDGILDVFDRYNFTVNEEEPLEKEVALDPELLGKIYEKLNAIREDNFDEYVEILNSKKKGEETKFNKEYGVYYTPREIVHYMCQQSLINYLETGLNPKILKEDIQQFVKLADLVKEHELVAMEREEKIKSGEQKTTKYESSIPESIKQNAVKIDNLLADIKVCDPAVGSGAFPIGMMHEIVKLRQLISIYKCSTDIPVCNGNTDIPVCNGNTDIPVCNGNTDIPVCEGNTDIPVCDNSSDFHITHRNLPHWFKSGSIYWVTFRLADSLPQEKINQWKSEYEIWLKHNPKPWNDKQWNEYDEKFGKRMENWLDNGYGSCILSNPEVRKILQECLFKFDGQRHIIHAVVIMPNHVHLLIAPFSGYSLSELLKGIKGTSAYNINKLFNSPRKKIWMEESYDHIVRSEKEYFHFVNYIKDNPIRANLSEDKYWLYIKEITQAFSAMVTQAFLPVKVTQTFLSVNVTQAFLPVNNNQSGISGLSPVYISQTGRSELPSDKAQTKMTGLPSDKAQTRMSELPSVNKTQTGMSVLHSSYDLKRHCIENSLYGVDIDPGAVEICKLRFWLSMIVDEEDFYNIKPLPNLDYKIVCGNSLLQVEKNLFNQEAFNRLEKLKHEYFNETNSVKKQQLKNEIEKLIYQITNGHKEFDFEVYFSEVFHEKGGFDIVIANPPYIQLQKDRGRLAQLYKDLHYETFARTGDIYTLFYEKGIQLLKPNGILCYITSNKWMRAGYGEKLRNFFTKYNPMHLIDLGPGIFESATVDTNILLIQKCENRNKLVAVTLQRENDTVDIEKQLNERGVILSNLGKDAWFIGSSAEQRLKEKIEKIGKPLRDWDVNIYYGIKTGLNEAFIITTEKRNEILANCKDDASTGSASERERTEAIIKPILRGRDIKRYYYEWAGLWVIVIPAGWTDENRGKIPPEKFILEQFPSLMRHLKPFEEKAKKRDDQGDYWWELRHCAYYPEFEKEKVVWQELAQGAQFAYDKKGEFFVANTAYILTGINLKYILGYLNSKLNVFSYDRWFCTKLGQFGTRWINQHVQEIPIPPITPANQHIVKQIEELVDKILSAHASAVSAPHASTSSASHASASSASHASAGSSTDAEFIEASVSHADTSEWEREIDRLVYQLYDLTEEEIMVVEGKSVNE